MKKPMAFDIKTSNGSSLPVRSLPLTVPQLNIWLQCLKSGYSAYEFRYIFKITGKLDVSKLEEAIYIVTSQHNCFATSISEHNGAVFQNIGEGGIVLEKLRSSAAEYTGLMELGFDPAFSSSYERPCRCFLVFSRPEEAYLIFVYHHIVLDGNFLKKVFTEISARYNQGYNDPVVSQKRGVENLVLWEENITVLQKEQAGVYWKHYLGTTIQHLLLPVLPAQLNINQEHGIFSTTLSKHLTSQLRELAHQQNSSLFKVLMSAFGIIIHRLTGEDDFSLSYYANLRPAQLIDIGGHYVGAQPMRFVVNKEAVFENILAIVGTEMQQRQQKEVLPYILAGNQNKPLPNCNVAFAKTVSGRHFLQLNGMVIQSERCKRMAGDNDLLLMYEEIDDRIYFYAEYKIPLTMPFINIIMNCLQALLISIVEEPKGKAWRLSILAKETKAALLEKWGNNTITPETSSTVVQLFDAQVSASPELPAIIYENEQLSYYELQIRTNKLAHFLFLQGVKKGDKVAFCIDTPVERIICLLAIAKTGATYLPVESNWPPNRVRLILDDAAPIILLVKQTNFYNFFFPGVKIISIDEPATVTKIKECKDTNPQTVFMPDDVVYILYTSGTTGMPKGVMIEQQGLSNFICQYSRLARLKAGTKVLQYISISFDLSGLEIWGTLATGGTLVPYKDNRLTGSYLYDFLVAKEINCAILPASIIDTMGLPDKRISKHLKTLITAGEASPAHVCDRWMHNVTLINGYGPTEATICVNDFIISGDYPAGTIGKPINNVFFYVLDDTLHPLPTGIPGELFIGGLQVAKGYLNKPELTMEKFPFDPFMKKSLDGQQRRMYKTGDKVTVLPGGNIEYLGRLDDQVKVHGYRIELAEIEALILQNKFVRQAVVVHYKDPHGKHMLVAYLVHENKEIAIQGEEASTGQLRILLQNYLPAYMIPDAFIWLQQIPVTDNGKINRKALPVPAPQRRILSALERPQNKYEQAIVEVWKQHLHLEEVSLYDNFFYIGGYSLLLPEIYAALPDDIKQRLTLPDLFSYPTIKSLCKFLSEY